MFYFYSFHWSHINHVHERNMRPNPHEIRSDYSEPWDATWLLFMPHLWKDLKVAAMHWQHDVWGAGGVGISAGGGRELQSDSTSSTVPTSAIIIIINNKWNFIFITLHCESCTHCLCRLQFADFVLVNIYSRYCTFLIFFFPAPFAAVMCEFSHCGNNKGSPYLSLS